MSTTADIDKSDFASAQGDGLLCADSLYRTLFQGTKRGKRSDDLREKSLLESVHPGSNGLHGLLSGEVLSPLKTV